MRREVALLAVVLSTGCDAVLGLAARPEAQGRDASADGDGVAIRDAGHEATLGQRRDSGGDAGVDASLGGSGFADARVPLHDGQGCFTTVVGACSGFACDCNDPTAGCTIACTPSPPDPDAGPNITCDEQPMCDLQCGDDCTIDCSGSKDCRGTTGADAAVTCDGVKGTCNFTLGKSSGMSCNGSGACIVTCLGACSVTCDLSTSCLLRCVGVPEDECSLDCAEMTTGCLDGVTQVCGQATCPDAGS